MPTPPSEESMVLFKLLSDGQWHRYLDVLEHIARTVPPGKAIRKYEEKIEYKRRIRNDPHYDTPASESERIEYGARHLARVAINSWRERHALMQRGEKPETELRLKPGFKLWGVDSEDGEEAQSVVEGSGVPSPTPGDSEGLEAAAGPAEEVPATSAAEVAGIADLLPPEPVEQEPSPPEVPSPSVIAEGGLPSCEQCGLPVADEAIHKLWHEAHDPLDEASLLEQVQVFDSERLVTLLGDMVDRKLDRFQSGMEAWLRMQFVQLESMLRVHRRLNQRWGDGAPKD